MSLLEATGMRGGYGAADILQGCTITCDRGEVAVIVGPNGAGKSTAIKAIFGMLNLREGEVTFDGKPITDLTPQARVEAGMGMVPQTNNVFPGMTVEENLQMGAFLREDGGAGVIEKVYDLFPAVKEKRFQHAGELSGGQRQQVAVGRAMMTEPTLLILDEPTAGVSPIVMDELFDRILEIAKTGIAVLMVEQNARQALEIADTGYVLVEGQNRFTDTGMALLADSEVRATFLGGDPKLMHEFANAFVLLSNFVLIPSITYGSQLALGALGITLVFSILRFANFAHGDTMAFGTVMAIFCTWGLQALGLSLGPLPVALITLPVAIALTIALVLGTDKLIYQFYRNKKVEPIILVMASVGVMFMMNGLVRILIGTGDVAFADGARFIIRAREFREMTGLDEGLALRTTQVITVVVAVIVMGALFWFLQKTRTGKSMRAFSDNEDLALLSGIKPERVVQVTWIIAATLATIAGVLYGLDKGFRPFTYFQLLLPMFAAAILGGIGQPIGAVVGGFVIAFSEVALTYAYRRVLEYLGPEGFEVDGLAQLIETEYKFAISFIILVIVLLVRPTGIFKGRVL